MRLACVLGVAMLAGVFSASANASDLAIPAHHGAEHHAGPAPACGPGDAATIVAPVALELRIGPSNDYERLAVVPPCRPLSVILCGYRTGWCQVRYGRYDGWLFDAPARRISHYFLGH